MVDSRGILHIVALAVACFFLPLVNSAARAEDTCSRLLSPPFETYFTGPEGQSRFFKDGAVWERKRGDWIHIGYGRYFSASGRISVDQVFKFPDLSPLWDTQYQVSKNTENRHYPNIDGYYPTTVYSVRAGSHKFEVLIPQKAGIDHIAEGVLQTLFALPQKRIEALKLVRLNTRDNRDDPHWRATYSHFDRSAATAADGEMDIYGGALSDFASSNANAVRITRHEFGHLIASKIFGSTDPGRNYIDPAATDTHSVSNYGNNSWAEDFAEGIEVYLRTNAGKIDPSTRENLLKRFAFFDGVFNYRVPQSERKHTELFIRLIDDHTLLLLAPEIGLGLVFDMSSAS